MLPARYRPWRYSQVQYIHIPATLAALYWTPHPTPLTPRAARRVRLGLQLSNARANSLPGAGRSQINQIRGPFEDHYFFEVLCRDANNTKY